MSNAQKPAKTVGEARARALAHPLVAAIMASPDIPHEDVPVPEWRHPETGEPIKLRVRGLSGRERDRYEARMATFRASMNTQEMRLDLLENRTAQILALCLFDPETDERIPITAEMLGEKSGVVTKRLAKLALDLSGLGSDAAVEAGKDSSDDPSDSSTTD